MPVVRRKVRLVNPRRRRRNAPRPWGFLYQQYYHGKRKRSKRKKNVGEVAVLSLNPFGGVMKRRHVKRRRANPRRRHNEFLLNPRRRRRNPVVRRRRRNPFGVALGTQAKQVLGIIGGATLTKLVSERLPFNLSTGPIGYLAAIAVSMVLGYGTGKLTKDSAIGNAVTLGGFTYVALRVLEDFLPSVAGVSSIGLRGGVGTITPSQGFAVPLVNQPGSMTQFVTPGFVTAAFPNTLQGLNAGRRLARVR